MPARAIIVLNFIISGTIDSLWPLMPFIAAEIGFTAADASFLRTEFYIPKLLFLFLVLAVARKVKNKRLISAAVVIMLFCYLALAFLNSFNYAVVVIGIMGIALTFYGPLLAAEIAMLGRHGNRGRITSNFTTAGEIGKLFVSTILGFTTLYVGWRYSMLGAVVVLMPIALFVIWKSRHYQTPEADLLLAKNDKISSIFKNHRVLAGAWCSFSDNFASSSLNLFLPFLVLALTNNAAYIPITAGAMLLGNITGKFFLGRATDSRNPAFVFIFCEASMAVLTLVIGLTNSIYIIVAITYFLGIFTKGTVPVYQIMIAKASDAEGNYKSSSALMVLTNNLGALFAAWFFGMISVVYGVQSVFIGFSIAAALATIPRFYYNHLSKKGVKALT